jgi:hypothetical protein
MLSMTERWNDDKLEPYDFCLGQKRKNAMKVGRPAVRWSTILIKPPLPADTGMWFICRHFVSSGKGS